MFLSRLNGFNCQWEGCGWVGFCFFLVARRSLVRGMFVALAMSLCVVECCNDAHHANAVAMAWRMLCVRQLLRLGC